MAVAKAICEVAAGRGVEAGDGSKAGGCGWGLGNRRRGREVRWRLSVTLRQGSRGRRGWLEAERSHNYGMRDARRGGHSFFSYSW
jgi:hypothetical protein